MSLNPYHPEQLHVGRDCPPATQVDHLAAPREVWIAPLLVFFVLAAATVSNVLIRSSTQWIVAADLTLSLLAAGWLFQRLRRRALREAQVRQQLRNLDKLVLDGNKRSWRWGNALRSQQRLVEQREALFAVNAAIYQATSFEESLQMIAELAPGVLDVDLCMVTLGEDEDKLRIAAVTRPHGQELVGKTLGRKGNDAETVRATRRVVVVDDAPAHPGVHPAFRANLRIGSMAYLPLLRTGGQFMGMVVLIRHRPGPFPPEQLNLAELFTSHAAAALEKAQLLEQTRRDAEAKTVLLRELNHRVKNNLASIITLLSINEPEMSAAARQWLDRAIARIRTMAGTHDLFSGGTNRVPLVDLVEQTTASLSVLKPPGVSIRAELDGASVLLRSDRAVAVAMVLHELCSNAIVHGLGDSGTVTIRARLHKAQTSQDKTSRRVVLEVVDEGRPPPNAPRRSRELVLAASENRSENRDAPSIPKLPASPFDSDPTAITGARPSENHIRSRGMGLVLVQGLVTRELGGTFCLSRVPDGGSVARVEFPIDADEAA